jgi:hypothetical protein
LMDRVEAGKVGQPSGTGGNLCQPRNIAWT